MNSYYSSDEEVAWGPITLREIKGDLKRSRRKPERRHTIHPSSKNEAHVCPEITVEPPTFCHQMENNVSSTCDEYYSPNESTKSSRFDINDDLVQDSSTYFTASDTKATMDKSPLRIQNHKDILETNDSLIQDSSAYLTASDTKATAATSPASIQNHNDTHIDFVKAAMNRNSYFDIQNFHHTLVEPTVLCSEQSFNNSCPNNSIESQEGVIEISSDEGESFEGDSRNVKDEKYSCGKISIGSEGFPERNRSLHEIEESSIYKREVSDEDIQEIMVHNITLDTSEEKENSSSVGTSSGNINEDSLNSSDEVEQDESDTSAFGKRLGKSRDENLSARDSNSDDVVCIDEANDSDVEKEYSIHNAKESFSECFEEFEGSNKLNRRTSEESSDYENNYGSSSDEIVGGDDKFEVSFDSSQARREGRRLESVEEEKCSNYSNDSLESARKSSSKLFEEVEESSTLNRTTNKVSSECEKEHGGFSGEMGSIEDKVEASFDRSKTRHGGRRLESVEEERGSNDSNESLENEKVENIHQGIIESHNVTDLFKSEHLPRNCNISPVAIPNIDFAQFDDSYDALSQLNDTMEMMDKLLNQANNASLADSESSDRDIRRVSEKSNHDDIISASFLQKPNPDLLYSEEKTTPLNSKVTKTTPNGRSEPNSALKEKQLNRVTPAMSTKSFIPKLKKSPSGDNFKIPVTPVWQKLPSKTSPRTCSNFRNIVSPVGMYIRHSPQPVLKKNVDPTRMGRVKVETSPSHNHKNKENLDNLPAVIYKPGKTQITTAERKQALPPSIEKMILEPGLTRHDRKLARYKSPAKITAELATGVELTRSSISDSLLEDPCTDVSILHKRDRPFLK
ncbi:uncharacterized protein isoform X1 [Leptinotarsa decemlineata]|uniref:uncharacterized protein isoform X1 n=1 Tax=Leptinotarsa decemlineata TaxID=7539 RepID=UPI003D3075DA